MREGQRQRFEEGGVNKSYFERGVNKNKNRN
uniref:Uncharacterized protein n=1 Tax=Medicago truncatula TaxID=3880 RepID=I3T921_MEDTR|nr:unknown [Medicago truncatula]